MKQLMSAVAIVALMAIPAMGAWADDFESYPLGSTFTGTHQGGWVGWGDSDAAIAGVHVTNTHAHSGSQAVDLGMAEADFVHTYSGYTSGQWVYSAWQYIPTPTTGQTETYFILMNRYDTKQAWAVQLHFDYDVAGGAKVIDDQAGGTGVPMAFNAWKQIEVVIDLDANTRTTYYDGTAVGTAAWYDTKDLEARPWIAAVDLYGANGGVGVCYDDISLVPEPTSLALLALGGLLLRRRR